MWESVKGYVVFILEILAIVIPAFLIAYGSEKIHKKKTGDRERILVTRKIAVIGMFSAISGILMVMELPLPFLIPDAYKLDFSEVPVVICAYAYGPVAGLLTEVIKIMIKLLLKPSSSAFVGEIANFVVGACLILPASIIYQSKKTKRSALIACATGTVCMAVGGSLMNYFYLLPAFARMYHISLELGGEHSIITDGNGINPLITDLKTFVALAVAPMNLVKGTAVSVITMLIYKPLRPFLKAESKKHTSVKSKVNSSIPLGTSALDQSDHTNDNSALANRKEDGML